MQRIALGIEYQGAGFAGWESQLKQRTVQSELQKALSLVANHPVKVICAGRTDTGVHAYGQVVHFETQVERDQRAWVFGTNSNLPKDVCVRWCHPVPADFHARFSARSRSYRYLIYNDRIRSANLQHRVTRISEPLNVAVMQSEALDLVGRHDFTSYRASNCQAHSPIRTIHRIDISRSGPLIQVDIVANAFLQHMVRNIIGVLSAVGKGKKPVGWAREVLACQDRRKGGTTAPPTGLYLTGVEYPEHYRIPRVLPPALVW